MRYLVLVLFIGCSQEYPTAPEVNLNPKEEKIEIKGYKVYRKVQTDTTQSRQVVQLPDSPERN